MWILVHGAEIPELARNYTVHWRLLPDLAMDLIVPVLSTMMTVEQAGRVFIALAMGALIGGTATLHRAIYGRVGMWPIWSVLFITPNCSGVFRRCSQRGCTCLPSAAGLPLGTGEPVRGS